jgi:radical SAM protein with 4Fe4S-binding SPASM domain
VLSVVVVRVSLVVLLPPVLVVVTATPYSATMLSPHDAPSVPAAVSPRSTATAVRWIEPSALRRGSPQIGQVTSALFAWQPQCAQGSKLDGMAYLRSSVRRDQRLSAILPAMAEVLPASPRELRPGDQGGARPIFTVWELTMKCDQPCQHCGSRAGHARAEELSTAEVLSVAASLADLGCREVALIGGEAYLRPDLHEIIAYLAGRGLRVSMQTGGRALTAERARRFREAGLMGLGVSIDGPAPVHDLLRGNAGSHEAALRALDAGREAGLVISANTQVNRLSYRLLRETVGELRAHGIESWQVQLTVPMGRAADRPEWIIDPWCVVEIIDTLASIQREAVEAFNAADPPARGVPFNIAVGSNIGYFGPHELTLRSRPGGREAHWSGCRAGIHVLGIESDGTVKACPSLPTAPYAGGNVRDLSLAHLWEHGEAIRFARDRALDELWGFCRTCYYADTCRAGCSFTAHCTLGRRGNNPFCYHRVSQLRRRGLRERLVATERALGEPYDFGRLELVEEPWVDEPEPRVARRLPLAAG